MSVLEWLLILEAVLLMTGGIFKVTSMAIGKDDPDDPFTKFTEVFWRVFTRRRGRVKSTVSSLDTEKARQYAEMRETGDIEGIKSLLADEMGGKYEFDDSEIADALDESIAVDAIDDDGSTLGGGRGGDIGPAPERPRAAIVNVKVIPFSNVNELVSIRRDGISVQVTCGPEEGQANKTVLDCVAQALSVKEYQVTLLKGHYKPFKVVQVAGFDQSEMDDKLAGYS